MKVRANKNCLKRVAPGKDPEYFRSGALVEYRLPVNETTPLPSCFDLIGDSERREWAALSTLTPDDLFALQQLSTMSEEQIHSLHAQFEAALADRLAKEGRPVEQTGPPSEEPGMGDDEKAAMVNEICSQLDKDNEDLWTSDGRPSARAVTRLAGFTVRTADINAYAPEVIRAIA